MRSSDILLWPITCFQHCGEYEEHQVGTLRHRWIFHTGAHVCTMLQELLGSSYQILHADSTSTHSVSVFNHLLLVFK